MRYSYVLRTALWRAWKVAGAWSADRTRMEEGKRPIECTQQAGGGYGCGEIEACDLAEGVDTGVGAAGTLRKHGFAGDVVDRGGERALDCNERGLDLPTVEVGAVVRQDEFPALHFVVWKRITAGSETVVRNKLRAGIRRD